MANQSIHVIIQPGNQKLHLKAPINSKLTKLSDLADYLNAYLGTQITLRVCFSAKEYFESIKENFALQSIDLEAPITELFAKSQIILND